MKSIVSKQNVLKFSFLIAPAIFLISFLIFSSFTIHKLSDDFLKQLGITRSAADEKITGSIFSGAINIYGIKNAKNIALADRKAIALDILTYTKSFVTSPAFVKQYTTLRENNKPKESVIQTPEEMKADNITRQKQFVKDAEETLKKNTNASLKAVFENNLADSKQRLKDAEDPNNKQYVLYAKNYPELVKNFKASDAQALSDWNRKYPENQLLYVKKRLQEFLDVTKDVDFNAELTDKNKKKVFVNPIYEHKDYRWKMAFRAGKDVVDPAREFVQKWIAEIN